MPLVEINLVEGRDPEEMRTLVHEVHNAVTHALEIPDQAVRVALRVLPRDHWAIGDVTIAERDQQQASTA